uniref:Uncharacterized protein n=1 Tax=Oryza sativa subsp. japonica TaxID=39947 RepID=Q8LNN3_ORYSJ|nr:hypothetical protein [Oryza sativa Japonica Group]
MTTAMTAGAVWSEAATRATGAAGADGGSDQAVGHHGRGRMTQTAQARHGRRPRGRARANNGARGPISRAGSLSRIRRRSLLPAGSVARCCLLALPAIASPASRRHLCWPLSPSFFNVGHRRNSTRRATEPSSSVGHRRVKQQWRRRLPIHSPPSLEPPPPHALVGKRAVGWVGMGKGKDVDCGEREGKKKAIIFIRIR